MDTTETWTPAGADPREWEALVQDAVEAVKTWLDGTDGMTPAQWGELLSGERETWGGHTADDWRYGFAVRVLDAYSDDLPQSILDAFREEAEAEGRIDDPEDTDAVRWACAEVAWREAVMAAEDRLGV